MPRLKSASARSAGSFIASPRVDDPASRLPAAISAVPRLKAPAGVGRMAFALRKASTAAGYFFPAKALAPRAVAACEFVSRQKFSQVTSSATITPHLD